jgi:hypothetical protein
MAGRKPICRCGSRCRNRSRRNSAHSAKVARKEFRYKLADSDIGISKASATTLLEPAATTRPRPAMRGNALQTRHRAPARLILGPRGLRNEILAHATRIMILPKCAPEAMCR